MFNEGRRELKKAFKLLRDKGYISEEEYQESRIGLMTYGEKMREIKRILEGKYIV